MKRVLRDLKTGLFFKNMDEWTPLIAEAANFRDTLAALQFCEKNNLTGVAVLLVYPNGSPDRVLAFRRIHIARSTINHDIPIADQ